MAEVKVLDSNSIKEGDMVVITQTVEKRLTKNDLLNMKERTEASKNSYQERLRRYTDDITNQIAKLDEELLEIDKHIEQLNQ